MLTAEQFPLIPPLFRQVFGGDISLAMLQWKYGAGRGAAYGYFGDNGELLVHCGLSYRRALADGQLRRIAHMGDLMAVPGGRGGLGRSAPFALVIQRMLDDLATPQNPDALAFGFPSDRAMRLGERLGLFSAIDQMQLLTFAPLPRSWRADRVIPCPRPDDTFRPLVDRLWQGMAEALGDDLIVVRDAPYLDDRYFGHPTLRYTCSLVRPWWGGRPLGVIVTRREGEQVELVDMVAPPALMGRLIQAARQHLADWGAQTLTLWLTEHHGTTFADEALRNDRMELRIMANPFSSGGNPQRFAGRWWLTSGDTDYH